MDKIDQMSPVASAVQELQASNTQLYDRLQNIVIGDKHIHCNEQTNTVQTEVSNLTRRISALDESRKLRKETISVVKDEIKDIKDRVDSLKATLSLDKAENESKSGPVEREHKVEEPKTSDVSPATEPTGKSGSDVNVAVSAPEVAGGRVAEKPADLQNKRRKPNRTTQTDERRTGSSGNTLNDDIITSHSPEVVRQEIQSMNGGDQYWRFVAARAMDEGKLQFRHLEGVHTVICLDISESMTRDNAWTDALYFIRDYLSGLEEMASTRGLSNEHVALVTFGHETKIQHHFTNKFNEIRRAVNTLRLGGPSPMLGGVMLSIAAAGSSEHQVDRTPVGVNVQSKVIIVSDGLVTENDLLKGPDIDDPSKLDETKSSILSALIEFSIDVVCIPVGNSSDMEFFKTIVDISSALLLDHNSGKRLSRNYFLHTQLLDPFGDHGTEPITIGDSSDLSVQDMEDLRFIQKRNNKLLATSLDRQHSKYRESSSKTLPVIGSRVRRGPDWQWRDQDSNGPGTVVGHVEDDQGVWVTWDNGETQIYKYGMAGYDVLTVDEPRQLTPGEKMAVGCTVRSGKDWKETHKSYNKGVVIKMPESNKAEVRWENGDRGTYSFYGIGGQEIEVCPAGFEPFNTDGHVLGYATSLPQSEPEVSRPNVLQKKNKNKNL